MKTVAMTSATQMPSTRSPGKAKSLVPCQGSGSCITPSTVIAATASAASAITGRCDSAVAATVTGASIRIANGFTRPPVRYKRIASWIVS